MRVYETTSETDKKILELLAHAREENKAIEVSFKKAFNLIYIKYKFYREKS